MRGVCGQLVVGFLFLPGRRNPGLEKVDPNRKAKGNGDERILRLMLYNNKEGRMTVCVCVCVEKSSAHM